jgi:hypothetical protein
MSAGYEYQFDGREFGSPGYDDPQRHLAPHSKNATPVQRGKQMPYTSMGSVPPGSWNLPQRSSPHLQPSRVRAIPVQQVQMLRASFDESTVVSHKRGRLNTLSRLTLTMFPR